MGRPRKRTGLHEIADALDATVVVRARLAAATASGAPEHVGDCLLQAAMTNEVLRQLLMAVLKADATGLVGPTRPLLNEAPLQTSSEWRSDVGAPVDSALS